MAQGTGQSKTLQQQKNEQKQQQIYPNVRYHAGRPTEEEGEEGSVEINAPTE